MELLWPPRLLYSNQVNLNSDPTFSLFDDFDLVFYGSDWKLYELVESITLTLAKSAFLRKYASNHPDLHEI